MSIQFKFDPEKRDPIDPTTTQTNGTRAAHGEAGVLAALASRGETGYQTGEDGIRDLLADIGHLCDREGLDFAKLIKTANKDWRAER